MTNAIAAVTAVRSAAVHNRASRRAAIGRVADSAFTSANAEGPFSLLAHQSVEIDAEAGLVIRVHAGCLWVPHHDEHCSVGVGAGEQFIVQRTGCLTVLGNRGTQVELEWPSSERSTASLH